MLSVIHQIYVPEELRARTERKNQIDIFREKSSKPSGLHRHKLKEITAIAYS